MSPTRTPGTPDDSGMLGDGIADDIDTSTVATDAVGAPETVDAPALGSARKRRARKPILIAVAAVVALLATTGGTLAALAKTVTISVDGATRQVTTLSGTVDGALSSAGLTVGAHDTLAPAGTAQVADGSQIVIQRGRLFTVTIDGTEHQVWTTATTVEAALAQLGQRASDFELSASRSREIPLTGLSVTADTLHTVTIATTPAPGAATSAAVASAPEELTTAAKTVGDLLEQQGITLAAADRVSPSADTPLTDGLAIDITTLPTVAVQVGTAATQSVITTATTVSGLLTAQKIVLSGTDQLSPAADTPLTDGMQIVVTRVSFTGSTATATIPQPADRKVNDNSLAKGKTKVTQTGHPGTVQITYKTKVINGKAGSPVEVSRTTVTEATPTIIHVGTYVAPPPSSSSSSSSSGGSGGSSGPAPSTSGGPGIGVWNRIAQCESTNNWSINTGNGYYGGLQFDIPTWLSNGGGQYAPRADLATKAQQIAIANNVYAKRGLRPWACAYILGLI